MEAEPLVTGSSVIGASDCLPTILTISLLNVDAFIASVENGGRKVKLMMKFYGMQWFNDLFKVPLASCRVNGKTTEFWLDLLNKGSNKRQV